MKESLRFRFEISSTGVTQRALLCDGQDELDMNFRRLSWYINGGRPSSVFISISLVSFLHFGQNPQRPESTAHPRCKILRGSLRLDCVTASDSLIDRSMLYSYASSFPLAGTTAPAAAGMGIGPPGESGNLAVKTSQPVSVTRRVCSSVRSYISIP